MPVTDARGDEVETRPVRRACERGTAWLHTSRSKTSVRTPSPPLPDCASHTPCSDAASGSPAAAAGRESGAGRGARRVQRQTLALATRACVVCPRYAIASISRNLVPNRWFSSVLLPLLCGPMIATICARRSTRQPCAGAAAPGRRRCGAGATRLVVQAPAGEARVLHERVKLGRNVARARQQLTLRRRGRHRTRARAQRTAGRERGAVLRPRGRMLREAPAASVAGTALLSACAPSAGCGSAWSGAALRDHAAWMLACAAGAPGGQRQAARECASRPAAASVAHAPRSAGRAVRSQRRRDQGGFQSTSASPRRCSAWRSAGVASKSEPRRLRR